MIQPKYCLLAVLLAFSFLRAGAQGGELPTEKVDIIKDFEARLMDTEKFKLNPELPPLDTITKRQEYFIQSKTLNVNYLPPKIRPMALRQEETQTPYYGFARIGAGFPKSLFAEASYDVISAEQLNLGVHFNHHSANNTNDIENQRFSFTDVGGNGTYYFDQGFAVNGYLNYSSDNVFYYGYNSLSEEDSLNLSFESDDVKQRFSLFSGGGKIFNGERTEADFNYSAGVDFYRLADNFTARETGADIRIMGTKWFNESHPLQVVLRTDFTSFKAIGEKQTLNNFFLQPSFTYHGDAFKVKIGLNLASHEDEYFLFPDVELAANLIENLLTAFAGAEGSLQKNNFRSLAAYNPFIESDIIVENTHYSHYFGGIKGDFQGINYRAQVGYKNADNLALFLANTDTVPRFNVLYDTVSIFSIQGSLTAPLFEGFELIGSVTQNIFDPKNQEKAWHLPSTSINIGARYTTMENQLLVKADLFVENGVPFKNEKNEAENLNALFDISLGVEYFFTENIGAFATINNLANNRRERWQHYPVFGLNALFGLTARF